VYLRVVVTESRVDRSLRDGTSHPSMVASRELRGKLILLEAVESQPNVERHDIRTGHPFLAASAGAARLQPSM
jgi:hypothetical protein